MQPRQTLIALLAAMAIFYVALFTLQRILPHPPAATNPASPTTASAPAEGAETSRPASWPAAVESTPALRTQPAGELPVEEGGSRELVRMGGAEPDSPYPMLLEIDPLGAEVVNAWIRGHYETVAKKKPYQMLESVSMPGGGESGSFATPEIRFEDRKVTVSLAGRVWKLDAARSTDDQKVWTLRINDPAGKPLAQVVKTYRLLPQELDKRTKVSTYDVKLSLQVENISGQPARIILTQRGPVGFRKEDPRAEDRMLVSGVWNGQEVKTQKLWRTDVAKKNGVASVGKEEAGTRFAWMAQTNKYFTCIMAPEGRTAPGAPALFSSMEGVTLIKGEAPAPEKPDDLTFRFVSVPTDVQPGKSVELAFDCYVGPKSKLAFEQVPEYKRLDYYAVMTSGYYFCAPAGLTGLMMWLLDFFHRIPPHNYGISIIMLVLVVRAILHPITKRSQVNMMKMQKQMAHMQPKLDAVKQRYANDRMAMNQAMMQLYKEEGINPAGNLLSCLPMMLQLPIWGALWQALASTIEMRHAPFDGWWIKDLAGQDALIGFSQTYNIPVISWMAGPISSFNLLPILLGISQMLQMKYMPRGAAPGHAAGPGGDQMEQQRKMMMYMSVFFMLMLYSAPSGLNLYIMASNLFGILEQWRIRQHLAELDAKKGDEPPPVRHVSNQPSKPSWLQRKWDELQKQVDEAKKQQGQRGR